MAKWNDIESSPAYAALPDERKASVKARYFDTVIAPAAPPERVAVLRSKFLGTTAPVHQPVAPTQSQGKPVDRSIATLGATQQSQQFERMSRDDGTGTVADPFRPSGLFRRSHADVFDEAPSGSWVRMEDRSLQKRETSVGEAVANIPARIVGVGASAIKGIGDLVSDYTKARDESYAKALRDAGRSEESVQNFESQAAAQRETGLNSAFMSLADQLHDASKERMEQRSPNTTIQDVYDDPLKNTLPFIGETSLHSAGDMMLAMNPATLLVLTAGLSNEIAETRMENDGRSGRPSGSDRVIGAVGGVAQSGLESFGMGRLLKPVSEGAQNLVAPVLRETFGESAKRVAKETGVQVGQETAEEGIGYLTETVGTKRGASLTDFRDAVVSGALAGGGLGAVIQAGKEAVHAVSSGAKPPVPPAQPPQTSPLAGAAPASGAVPPSVQPTATPATPAPIQQGEDLLNGGTVAEQIAASTQSIAPSPAPGAQPISAAEAQEAAIVRGAELEAKEVDGNITADELTELDALRQNIDNVGMLAAMMGRTLEADQDVAPDPATPAAAPDPFAPSIDAEFSDLFDDQGRPKYHSAQSVWDFKSRTGLGADGVRAIQNAVLEGSPITIDDARQKDSLAKERRAAALEKSKAESKEENKRAKENAAGPRQDREFLGEYEIPGLEGSVSRVRVFRQGDRFDSVGQDEGTGNNDISGLIRSGLSVEQALATIHGDHGPNDAPNASRVKRIDAHAASAVPQTGLTNAIQSASAPDSLVPSGSTAKPVDQDVTMQNRARDRAASVVQMHGIANNPDPARLSYSRDPGTGAPMVYIGGDSSPEIADSDFGRSDTVTMANGRKVPVRYAVVEADQIQASHTVDGASNPDYSQPLQAGGVRALNNGRTAGLQSAFARGSAGGYVEGIIADGALHGVSAEAIRSKRKPVLVRVYPEAENTGDMGAESNASQALGLSASEQAATDARALPDMETLSVGEDGDLLAAGNRPFIRSWLQAMGQNEASRMLSADGEPTKQMIDRLKAAIFHRAYGADRLTSAMAEDASPEMRNILAALTMAAPRFARIDRAGAFGDVAAQIADAIELIRDSKARGIAIGSVRDMFSERASVVDELAKRINDKARAPRKLGELLNELARFFLAEQSAAQTVDIFGRAPLTYDDAIKAWDQFDEQQNPDAARARAKPAEPETASGAVDPSVPVGDSGPNRSEAGREGQPAEQAKEPGLIPALMLSAQQAPVVEAPRAAAAQTSLFAPPTRAEVIKGAERKKDAERNGENSTGRTDMMAGDGELFAGPLPEQLDVEQEANKVSERRKPWEVSSSEWMTAERAAINAARASDDAEIPRLRARVDYNRQQLRGKMPKADRARLEQIVADDESRILQLSARPLDSDAADITQSRHRRIVESAIGRGESIPAEVLAEYPDLAESEQAGKVEAAAAEAATSPTNDKPEPTDAQKKAGNYAKGHITLHGLGISIENPAGTRRRSEWPALAHHYGYFKGTEGKDGDHVDVFLGSDAENAELPVFVIDQVNKSGRFDEHKVMLGFTDETSARAGYLANYTPGWNGLGGITEMSLPDFKSWVSDPARTTKRASADKAEATVAGDVRADGVMPSSWVIREKATGAVIMETFDKKKVDALNTDKYEAVPIRQHLASLSQPKLETKPMASAPKTPPKVTPQIPSSRQLDDMIKVAADSIDKLRKSDVDRVLSEAPAHFRLALSMHISQKRPDLAAEVREVMDETSADRVQEDSAQAEKEKPAESKPDQENDRRYHVVAINEKTGEKTIMSSPDEPMTHSEAVTMKSKITELPWRRVQLEEATDEATVKESLPVEKPTADMTSDEGATAEAAPKAELAQPASKTPNIDTQEAAISALRDGTLTVDQYRAAFESALSGEQAIKEELAGKTKDALLGMLSPMLQSRYRGDKKADVVNVVYREMVSDYALRGFSYGMSSGSRESAIRNLVESETAETLAAYAEKLKSARAARAEETAAREESIADPKTLDDFRLFIRNARLQDRTYQESYLMLTPEQRARYDALEAESTREAREERQRKAKTEVRAAGQATDGQIIEAMHTRDHYPLFVVQLSDRLSADDYRTVLAGAKKLGGWYSKFRDNGAVPGFQFKDRAAAEAFVKLAGGDTSAVESAAEQRRDAFDDDRSQSAVERLREMADRLDESAESVINSSRKTNTARRAAFAASALNSAEADKALAKTMRNIASAIESGTAKFLNMVRTKTQVELLRGTVRAAKDNELRAKYSSYTDQEKHKGQPATDETAGFAEFPAYTAFRSDLASLARQMLEVDGLKKLGQQLMTVADDVTDAYIEFAKQPANLYRVSSFAMRRGDDVSAAVFKSKDDAEKAIKRSGLVGKAIVLTVKRGDNRVVMSPSEAINQGIWTGDGDKRITLTPAGGEMLVEAIGRRGNKTNKLTVPWQFQNAYDRRKALSRMGIETAAEFRSALREFIGMQAQANTNKVREMELAMVGRKNDGLDFFPTPEHVADQMIEAAEIQAGMRVLEPSAGMGHIADRIREAGSEPDVIEMAGERRELLQEKGYSLVASDFTEFTSPTERGFTFGDLMRAPDGTVGILRGQGGMGSDRVRLVSDEAEPRELGKFNFSELEGVERRGVDSGYDRIVMNPPFSNRRDAEHVRHAYSLLKPGGRIVAIMGEGVFFGQDKKAQDFREWLEDVGGTSEKLPPGSFMDPSLPVNTGVSARMVVIDKAASDVMLSRPAPETITVDGVERPRTNSKVQPIHDTEEGLRNFWRWFSPQPSQLLDGLSVSEIRSLERHTKALADFIERQSSLPKTDRFKVIQRPVLTHMVGVVNNDKIIDAVIRSIPVDVVNFLGRKEWSAKEALHDVSVLEDVLTIDPETDVSFGVNPSSYPELTVRLIANAGAKITGLTGGAFERNSAVLANENDPVLGAHVAKSPNKDLGIIAGFGDSKAVDSLGRPLVVYHGTTADFDTFDLARAGEFGDRFADAAFFTSSPLVASGYSQRLDADPEHARLASAESDALSAWGRAVVEQYAATRSTDGEIANPAKEIAQQLTDQRRSRRQEVFTNEVVTPGANVMPVFLSLQNPLVIDAKGANYHRVHADAIASAIESGADGVIVKNVFDSANEFAREASAVYIAFRPEQIKSATGNNGDFSPDDARITHSRATDPVVLSGESAKRSALRDVLDGWNGDVPVVKLLESHEDIPLQYRDSDGHWKTAEGFFADGKVFVVLGSNRDATRAVEVLRHEAVGHYGVEQVLGGEWDGLVKGIADVRTGRKGVLSSAEWKAVIRDTAIRYPDFASGDKIAFSKEVLAVAAERGITGGIMDRIIAKVRQFLRRLGLIDGSYSEAEARDVLRRALKTVTNGSQDASTEYVQSPQMSTPDRAEAAGRVAQVFLALAESDPDSLMRYAKSTATDLPAVVSDILGRDVKVTRKGAIRQNFEQKVPGAIAILVPAEKWTIRSGDGKPFDVYVEGEHANVPMTGRRLFIDAAFAESGKSMGSGIYAALFQYALNNGMVFTGDPAGLSDAALLRRTEHMLSAAIKHGTTRMMHPHPRQMDPADRNHGLIHTWVAPLKWTIGDDAANIAAMLDTSTRNTMGLLRGTDANGYVYSLSDGRLLDARGEVVSKQRLVDLASQATATLETRVKAAGGLATEAIIGSTTIARAISAQSLIRQVQGRSSLLADVAERLSRASVESDPLYRAFYSASAPTFYSAMLQAVEAGKGAPKRADATAWMQWLDGAARRGEIKADERYWLGLDEWLDSQQGQITREALADFVRANGVQVTETVLGERLNQEASIANNELWEYAKAEDLAGRRSRLTDAVLDGASIDEIERVSQTDTPDAMHLAMAYVNAARRQMPSKYGEYTLPGGENYREVLLTLPDSRKASEGWKFTQVKNLGPIRSWDRGNEEKWAAIAPNGDRTATFDTEAAARSYAAKHGQPDKRYKSSHWDQPNVLAHIRVNDRTDADGKRVLFVEEIQSDWGQEGKKQGIKPANAAQEIARLQAEDNAIFGDAKTDAEISAAISRLTPEQRARSQEIQRRITEINTSRVPSAPFIDKTDKWLTLALKRVLRMAVDGGYDKVAFVNGQQSEDRYWGNDVVRPAVERWNEVTKPQSIRELGEDVLGREMASLVALDHVDAGVLAVLKHDQVRRAVVEAIPVDVVNMLRAENVSPDELLRKKDVIASRLSIDSRRRAADGIVGALRLAGASVRAKLGSLTPSSGDIEILPALRASQLNTREVAGLLDPVRLFHRGAGSSPEGAAPAGAGAKPLPGKDGRGFGGEQRAAELAGLLNSHAAILGRDGLLTQGVEPPPGEGMKAFYDKIVPAAVKDLLKKVGGGQIEAVDLNTTAMPWSEYEKYAVDHPYRKKNAPRVQGFTINAAMRQKVSAGLPLFSRRNPQIVPPVQAVSPSVPTQGTMPQAVAARGKIADLISPESFDRLIYEFQDKFIDLRRVQDRITELGGAISDINDAYLGEELFHARLAKRTQNFLRDELKPLLASLKSAGIPIAEFETFLHARHAPEANAVLADRNPNQATIDQARATALAAVKSLELQLQTAQVQGTSVKAINDALDTAREDLARWNRAQAFRGTEAERLSLSGMTDADAAAHMAAIDPGKRVTLDALAAKIDAMQSKTLDTLVSYGLMDKASIDAWRQTYQYYIPLHRDEAHPDSVAHPTGSGFNVRGDASRGRTGSNEKVTHILSHIAMQREAALTRGEKNHVVKKLYLMATQNKDPDFWTVDTPLTSKIVDPSTGFVRQQVDPLFKSRPHVVMLRIAGKDRAIVFNEHNKRAVRLAHSLKNLDVDDLHYVLGAAAKATRWFASVNTQYNPVFGFLNLWRDAQSAVLNLSSTALRGKQAAVMARILPAMRAIYRERRGKAAVDPRFSRLWEEMQIEGGVTGYRDLFRDAGERAKAIDSELRSMDRGKVSKAAHAIVDWLDHYNTALENAVRLAAYDVALSQGMSKPRAASVAKNLTVNFNRKGRQTREVGALYAFFNASVQGNARTLQTLTGPAGKAIVAGGIGIGFVASMLAAAFMGEDDYEKIPDFVRERSLVIPIGGGKYFSWPYPLGFHVLPNLGRIAAEMMMGVKKPIDGYVDTMMIAADTFSPLGSASGGPAQMLSPTALDPAVALMQNSDWTGMPIYKEDFNSLDPTPGHTRAKDSASLPAKVLSEFANWATGGNDYEPGRLSPTPDQIDFITGQITGGLGREILKAMQVLQAPFSDDELPLHKVPLVGRIIGSTRGQSGEAGRFYSAIRELNVLDRELEGRIESGDDPQGFMQENPQTNLIEFGKASYNQVKKLRKLRDQLSDAGAERDAINAVNDQITETMAELNKAMSEAD